MTSLTQSDNKLLESLKLRWQAITRLDRGLLLLVALRIGIVLIFLLNVLPLERRYGWYLQHGGDQEIFFDMAYAILRGEPEPELVGLGSALVMLPFVWLATPASTLDQSLIVPIVIINGFILGGLSVWLVGRLAKTTLRSDRIALWSAGLWAVLPLVTYFAFFWHPESALLRSANVPKIGWLNSLSDGPATFWVLLAATLMAANLHNDRMPGYFFKLLGAGAAMGIAFTFRVHIAPMLAVLGIYAFLAHGLRGFLVTLIGAIFTYVPQAMYNMAVFNTPVAIGYIAYGTCIEGSVVACGRAPLSFILRNLPFSPSHLIDNFAYHLGRRWWLVFPLLGATAGGLGVTWLLWKRYTWREVILIFGVPLSYAGIIAASWPSSYDPIRFSIPAMPFAIILGVLLVFTLLGKDYHADTGHRRPGGRGQPSDSRAAPPGS
ncbi:MAG: hypothetical protein GYB64_09055 [Chloroflexi bacterium]|nr:hypothetical protein [Chloroflexota bacterium]